VPRLALTVPHSLDKAEARSRLEKFAPTVREKYKDMVKDVYETWDEDTLNFGFKTAGMKIGGDLKVEENQLSLTGNLPFAAMVFKGKIETLLRSELEKLMA